jgi:hypothetical protein
MLTDLLIIALAAAFVISFIERWFEEPGILRGVVALGVSIGGVFAAGHGHESPVQVGYLSCAATFISLLLVLVGERLASVPPVVIRGRS